MIKKNLRHKIHVLEAEKGIDHSVALTKAPNKEDYKGIMLLVSEVKKKLKHFDHSPQEIKKILSDIANNPEYIGDILIKNSKIV